MIALVVDGAIFLKASDQTIPDFEREGLRPFSYKTKQGIRVLNSYGRMPERLHDEPDELGLWARRALKAARRTGTRAVATRKSAATKSRKRTTPKRRR
jgi:DNA transformation protein